MCLMLVCLSAAAGFAGCIGSDPIVGTWETHNLGIAGTMVFKSDHTMTANIPSMGITVSGKWESQGNGQYIVTYTTGQSYTCQIGSGGKTMTSGYGALQEIYTKIS